jgi:putative transposase
LKGFKTSETKTLGFTGRFLFGTPFPFATRRIDSDTGSRLCLYCGISGVQIEYLKFMPRKLFYPTPNPYHICCRSINKDWFESPMTELWELFSDYLFLAEKMFELKIHSFVLMNNHFHLLVTAPQLNISQAMQYFTRETSKQILRSSSRINCTFARPFFRSEIIGYHHFMTVYKYIYRNPVEAGLTQYCEAYPYSTLNGLVGFSRLFISLQQDTLLFDDVEQTLKWLNRRPDRQAYEDVRKALKRREFTLPRKRGQQNPLEFQIF